MASRLVAGAVAGCIGAVGLGGAPDAVALIAFASDRCADELRPGVPLSAQPPPTRSCGSGVWTMNDDTTNPRRWTEARDNGTGGSLGYGDPNLSPDGRFVAMSGYSRTETEDRPRDDMHLFVLDLRNGALHDVSPPSSRDGQLSDGSPAWSPDGRKLVFISNRSTGSESPNPDLFTLDLASGTLTRLTHMGGTMYPRNPGWSPDGARIVFQASDVSRISEGIVGASGAYTVDAASGQVTKLTTPAEFVWEMSYAPDGRSIGLNMFSGVYQAELDGSDLHALVTPDLRPIQGGAVGWGVQQFTWADGGESVIFSSWDTDETRAGLYRQSVEPGRTPVRLTNHWGDMSPTWAGSETGLDAIPDDAPPAVELINTLTGEIPTATPTAHEATAARADVFRLKRERLGYIGVDGTGLRRVSASISTRARDGRCRFMKEDGFTARRRCNRRSYFRVRDADAWRDQVERLRTGRRYVVRLRARDVLGQATKEPPAVRVRLRD